MTQSILILLSEYLDEMFRIQETFNPTLERAHQIYNLDKDEQYCHVQFPGDPIVSEYGEQIMVNATLTTPKVWRIKAWHASNTIVQKQKIYSETARQQSYRLKEREKIICNAIMDKLKLPNSDCIASLVVGMARMTNEQLKPTIAQFKIDIDILLAPLNEVEAREIAINKMKEI